MITKKYDIFISYAGSDTNWVQSLVKELEKRRVKVCLKGPNGTYRPSDSKTLEELRNSRFFVVLFDKNSVDSPLLNFLLGAAIELEKKIVPIISKDVSVEQLPVPLRWRVEKRERLNLARLTMDDPEDVAHKLIARVQTNSE